MIKADVTRHAERGTRKSLLSVRTTSWSRRSFGILFVVRRLLLQGGMVCLLLSSVAVRADDSWTQLQDFYGAKQKLVVFEERASVTVEASKWPGALDDPWAIMQTYYVPFTEADEDEAFQHPGRSHKVSGFLHSKLGPYQSIIDEVTQRFDIPPAVLGAVIMVESSGNAKAKAKTSSAKGLMQTIKSTFAEARAGLKAMGINIPNDPYNPKASVLAGSWYLDRMFRQMERDSGRRYDRDDLAAWRKVAEYYYAGPTHGRKRAGVVIIYAGGRRIVVDKAGYAQKVMRWAKVMS